MLSFIVFYNISVIMSGINNYQNRFNLEIIPTFVPHFIFDLLFCLLSNLMYVIYVFLWSKTQTFNNKSTSKWIKIINLSVKFITNFIISLFYEPFLLLLSSCSSSFSCFLSSSFFTCFSCSSFFFFLCCFFFCTFFSLLF